MKSNYLKAFAGEFKIICKLKVTNPFKIVLPLWIHLLSQMLCCIVVIPFKDVRPMPIPIDPFINACDVLSYLFVPNIAMRGDR